MFLPSIWFKPHRQGSATPVMNVTRVIAQERGKGDGLTSSDRASVQRRILFSASRLQMDGSEPLAWYRRFHHRDRLQMKTRTPVWQRFQGQGLGVPTTAPAGRPAEGAERCCPLETGITLTVSNTPRQTFHCPEHQVRCPVGVRKGTSSRVIVQGVILMVRVPALSRWQEIKISESIAC